MGMQLCVVLCCQGEGLAGEWALPGGSWGSFGVGLWGSCSSNAAESHIRQSMHTFFCYFSCVTLGIDGYLCICKSISLRYIAWYELLSCSSG